MYEKYISSGTSEKIKIIANVLYAAVSWMNTLALLVLVLVMCLTDYEASVHTFVALVSMSFIFCVTAVVSGITLRAVSHGNSIVSEVIGDVKIIKTYLFKRGHTKESLLTLNTFLCLYHLVWPIVAYALIRHRHLKMAGINPANLGFSYNKHKCPGYVLFHFNKDCLKSNLIKDSDIDDHMVHLGSRYYIKDSESASYLLLSYGPVKLLNAFDIDNNEILGMMLDMTDMNNISKADMDNPESLIKNAFVVF